MLVHVYTNFLASLVHLDYQARLTECSIELYYSTMLLVVLWAPTWPWLPPGGTSTVTEVLTSCFSPPAVGLSSGLVGSRIDPPAGWERNWLARIFTLTVYIRVTGRAARMLWDSGSLAKAGVFWGGWAVKAHLLQRYWSDLYCSDAGFNSSDRRSAEENGHLVFRFL